MKIKDMYERFSESLTLVSAHNKPSVSSTLQESLTKYLIIAIASEFECNLTSGVIRFTNQVTHNPVLACFVKKQAVGYQYYSWFDWKSANNANKLFGLFGVDFKNKMKNKVERSSKLKESIRTFMEIGRKRNALIHNNIAAQPNEHTLDEVYDKYKQSRVFVRWFVCQLLSEKS